MFLDEVDAIVGGRGGPGEHEASRRFKTELYCCIDGLTSGSNDGAGSNVMVLAATNCPWDLDDAMRRRLEKRIYIPLPDVETREQLFGIQMGAMNVEERCLNVTGELAKMTEGYSGSDINLICREAAMVKMRLMIEGKGATEIIGMRQAGGVLEHGVVVGVVDFVEAVKRTKRSVGTGEGDKFVRWEKMFGSG